MGPQAVEIFDNWSHLSDEQRDTPAEVWGAFRTYFKPKSNFRLARFQLREINHLSNEPIDSYVTRLKVQASKCNFASPEAIEDKLIDQIIKGTSHRLVRKPLLDLDPCTLTLDQVLRKTRTHEATETHMQQLVQPHSVDSVNQSKSSNHTDPRSNNTCKYCGGPKHRREECPASGEECHKCKKKGHWAKVCHSMHNEGRGRTRNTGHQHKSYSRSKSQNKGRRTQRHGHHVSTVTYEQPSQDLSRDFEDLTMPCHAIHQAKDVGPSEANRTEAYATIRIEPYPTRTTNLYGKVDTGAQGNILPLRTYQKMYPKFINSRGEPINTEPSDVKLTAYVTLSCYSGQGSVDHIIVIVVKWRQFQRCRLNGVNSKDVGCSD